MKFHYQFVSRFTARLFAVATLLLALGGCFSTPDPDADVDFDFIPPTEPEAVPGPGPEPAPPIAPTIVRHGPREAKRVALTFDACSTQSRSGYDERITKILVDMKVPATLFLGGKWMEEHPAQTRYLASLPQFELANHSYLHPHMTEVSEERALIELRWTQDIMHALTGRRATLFRAPYGEIDSHVVRLAADAGLVTVQFDLASGDADKNISKEKLIEYIAARAKNGSIVVLHMNRRGWHTAEALPEIIHRLRKRGFELVTVGQLLAPPMDVPAPAAPTPTPTTVPMPTHVGDP